VASNLRRNEFDGLSVESVTKRFGDVAALDGLSLKVGIGEIVGLFGRDGAGKTLCFEAIMGLTAIDSGRIVFRGNDITALTVDERAPLGLAYLPQGPSIFRGMTTAQNISAVLEHTEPIPGMRSRRLEELLDAFDIAYVRDAPSSVLSGGERRRCEVARSMASSPVVMILDEPFAGIDPMSVASIKSTIVQLRMMGVGVLLSDQNLHEAIEIIDRAYVIDHGRLIYDGTARGMMADKTVRELYLGDDEP